MALRYADVSGKIVFFTPKPPSCLIHKNAFEKLKRKEVDSKLALFSDPSLIYHVEYLFILVMGNQETHCFFAFCVFKHFVMTYVVKGFHPRPADSCSPPVLLLPNLLATVTHS